MAKRCVNGIVCVEEVWRRVRRLAEGSPVTTTSVETPKAVADVWGGAPTATRPKQKGLGGLAAHLGGGFGLLLGSLGFCYSSRARVRQVRLFEIYRLPQA